MTQRLLLPLCLVIFFMGCKKKEKITPVNIITTTVNDSANVQHISVLTQHNDNTRAGLNNKEAALTTSNVNTAHFGKQFFMITDDDIYAQPLIVGNLQIGSGVRNVAFIATVNNTIYAYD